MVYFELFTIVSNTILSALFNSIIIFSNAEYTLLLLDNKLMLEPGF